MCTVVWTKLPHTCSSWSEPDAGKKLLKEQSVDILQPRQHSCHASISLHGHFALHHPWVHSSAAITRKCVVTWQHSTQSVDVVTGCACSLPCQSIGDNFTLHLAYWR